VCHTRDELLVAVVAVWLLYNKVTKLTVAVMSCGIVASEHWYKHERGRISVGNCN
jgi:hypothetical protein